MRGEGVGVGGEHICTYVVVRVYRVIVCAVMYVGEGVRGEGVRGEDVRVLMWGYGVIVCVVMVCGGECEG